SVTPPINSETQSLPRKSWRNGITFQRADMREVGAYRGDDDPGFHLKQVDADQRNSHPRIDDDALVQHSVKHVYEAGLGRRTFQRHDCHNSSTIRGALAYYCFGRKT